MSYSWADIQNGLEIPTRTGSAYWMIEPATIPTYFGNTLIEHQIML
jgi:hypothetical protein